jgi:hypothetical protein
MFYFMLGHTLHRGLARRHRLPGNAGPYRLQLERLEERQLLSGLLLSQAASAYAQLPLSFEANRGQTDPQVNYVARGNGYSLFLMPSEAVLNFGQESGTGGQGSQEVLRMELVGGNAGARPAGLQQLPGTSNYFVGNDPSKWHTGIPTFARVEYQQVYPGIDLVYYGNQSRLEYDFVVAPRADPNQITLRFDGADGIRVDSQGNLILQTVAGNVVEPAPVVYQKAPGIRTPVAGGYVLGSDGLVHFYVGAYDHSQPLTIDPVLVYSTFLGGSTGPTGPIPPAGSVGSAIAVNANGEAFIAGYTNTSDFPTTNPLQSSNHGNYDTFVAKMNAAGTALIYSTYLGGSSDDLARGIAVDGNGNAYVTGFTFSGDFPLMNPIQQSGGSFVAKLNPTGSALVYSTRIGDMGTNAQDIAVDPNGNAYITGSVGKVVGGTPSNVSFVTKINAGGSAIVYSMTLGVGSGNGIAADASGNAYVTGVAGANFPTKNAFQATFGGVTDAFVTKINPDGSDLVYSSYLGGSQADSGKSIAVDGLGNAYVTGTTSSSNLPTTPGALETTATSANVGFVSKVAADGSALVYSTYLGGTSQTDGNAVAVDSDGNAYVAGVTGAFLTPTPFPSVLVHNAFVAKLNGAGSALGYVAYLDPASTLVVLGNGTVAYAIAVDGNRNAYVTGNTSASDFPTLNAFQPTLKGTSDAFLSKLTVATVADSRDPRFVTKAYHDLLMQTPDTTAVNQWSLVLDQGASRTRVALAIANSPDYFTIVIDQLYQKYLKRAPDQTGMSDDLKYLTQGGGTVERVEAAIVGSAEYFAVRCGSTNQGWEDTMYSDVFGRPIDATGKSNIDALLSQGAARQNLAFNVFTSDEFRQELINGFYLQYLGRPAEQTAINAWLGYLQSGARDEQVVAGIVGSVEYFSHV